MESVKWCVRECSVFEYAIFTSKVAKKELETFPHICAVCASEIEAYKKIIELYEHKIARLKENLKSTKRLIRSPS